MNGSIEIPKFVHSKTRIFKWKKGRFMTKVRQDAWSHEDDVLLADTVLNHIKRGSTQLKAFEEVGDQLNRTAAACGFRWNAVVRDQYDNKIADAKRERKNHQRKDAANAVAHTFGNHNHREATATAQTDAAKEQGESMSIDDVISFLQQYKHQSHDDSNVLEQNKSLTEENQHLRERLQKIEQDHDSLMQVINRARNMMFLDESTLTDSFMSSSFRMDENGNLQQVSKAD